METDLRLKERHQDEISFFDKEAESIIGVEGKRFRLTNTKTYEELFSEIPQFRPVVSYFGDIRDKRLLDLGCGNGWTSLYFARSGADVFSVDISPKSIELVRRYAAANGLENKIKAEAMPAEHLAFEDEFFDYVFMNAALHHCDIGTVSREISRVLKPGGRAAVIEDFAYHPLMNLYRKLSRDRHTRYEKPLNEAGIELFCIPFRERVFGFTGLINFFGEKGTVSNLLQSVDDFILKKIPGMKKYCKLIGIYVSK